MNFRGSVSPSGRLFQRSGGLGHELAGERWREPSHVAFVLRVFDHLGEFVIQTPFRNASWTFVCYNGAMTTTELSRFFRKKHNTQQVLAQFALTARDETDLDALLAELVRVVDETLQPEQVSVWLRDTKSPKDV